MNPVLEASGLRKRFISRRNLLGRPTAVVDSVNGVDLHVDRGETLAVVGESGAGKSTVGRLVLRLIDPDAGTIRIGGTDVMALNRADLRALRSRARMIFQDPFSSLDPRMAIGASIGEPLKVHQGLSSAEQQPIVVDLLRRVGLGPEQLEQYPHEFSGGQLQRIAIARAVSTNPELIVCDEPVAALDMSIRAQVMDLLQGLQDERGLSYLFISHDLSLVRLIAHRTAVMYNGAIVEQGPTEAVFNEPLHPYTRMLLEAIPRFDRAAGERARARVHAPDDAGQFGSGCSFADRCPARHEACVESPPPTVVFGVTVRCHLYPSSTEVVPHESSPVEQTAVNVEVVR